MCSSDLLGSEFVFSLQMQRLFGSTPAPESELHAMWWLLCRAEGRARLPQIIQYIDERYANTARWIPPLHRLDLPALVLWGDRDPVAVYAMAERLHREIPRATLVRLANVGHYPMVEDPARFVQAILGSLKTVPQ